MLNAGASRPALIRIPACRRLHPSGGDWGQPKACEGTVGAMRRLGGTCPSRLAHDPPDPDGRTSETRPPGRSGVDLVGVDPREGSRWGLAMPRRGRNSGVIVAGWRTA